MNHLKSSRMRFLLLGAMVLMFIAAVSMHVIGPIFLAQIGLGAFSLNNPIFYILIGLFSVVFAMFKLKHVSGFLHRKKEQSEQEMAQGVSGTSNMGHEPHQHR